MSVKVLELHKNERPREKAMMHGVESLSNRELLALLLRCGYQGTSVLQLSDNLLYEVGGLMNLRLADINDLMKVKGISKVKALELLSCFELSKRASYEQLLSADYIDSPKTLSEYLNKKIGFEKQEHFHVLYLNVKNQIIYEKTVFVGTLNTSVVHPREIFKEAIQKNAAKIVISHNHPSSNCTPSKNDDEVTRRLKKVGEIMGITLLDHLIVSHNKYYSFKENNLI